MTALAPGSRLGPYEITAKLGEGGMGEVWRARDAHLGRDVALKVLPDGFTQDPERLARFEREAKLLAQLNHPSIAQIYGLETSSDTRALVMELVEGPTLAERLEAGPFPFNESLSVSLQVAQALEEAHEKGIVHRDLKPQNVKASIEGKVKVLDFGLAKAMDPAAERATSASQLAASPTLTLGATVQGVILGTAAYMAPEQAAGGTVDRRADIWSFGVVLYEMLAGRRLFEGETVSHVLAGVLKEEPDFSALPAETPARIRWLVRRCLRKRPRERLQSIGDARLVLEELLAGADRDEALSAPASAAAPLRATSWKSMTAVGAALLALGLAAGRWLLAPRVKPTVPVRLELAVPEGWSLQWGAGHAGIALSPDGRRLALAVRGEEESRSGLLVRDLGELEPRLLAGTEGARVPFFSPDGEWIAYCTDKELSKVAVAGGKPIRLAEVQRQSRGGAWGPDGYLYFSADSEEGISRVAESGGAVEAVTTLDPARQERTHRWPELSADGSWLLFANATTASPNSMRDARVEAVRLATGERHILVEGASHAHLLADDVLIYLQASNLFALAVDPERLAPRGKPVALEQEVAANLGTGALWFAPSRRGSAVWIPGVPSREGSMPTWLTLDGKSSPISIPEAQSFYQLELAPDGRRAALTVGASGVQGTRGADIWIADFERGTLTRLSFGENGSNPTWTLDGRRVAYRTMSVEAGAEEFGVAWRPADGSGEAEVLLPPQLEPLYPTSFSPDGRLLALVRTPRGTGDLWLLPLDPPGAPRPFLAMQYGEYDPSISPNGRWIAYLSDETGNYELYVRPFPEGSGKWQLSAAGALEPRWSADGKALFFRGFGGRLMRVGIEPGAVFRASAPEPLVGGFQTGPGSKTYGIAPDGQRFLTLPLARAGQNLRAVAYSDDWLVRARRLLAPPK